ncbi:MAG: histidine phosphatase family protein [Actinomycetota bacterium]|nr:histidine phosphatase family protein [Actinomycetota bacterium]
MSRVYLVRHGRASAGWDVDPDPALDDLGRSQALAVAAHLRPLGPLHLVTSPLLRCQQTAFPLGVVWGVSAVVEPLVAEIPSPEGVAMSERLDWLREAMAGTWAALGERYTSYRDSVVAAVLALPTDTVVCSHFVAINAVIGAALGDDRLVIRSLDNCSVTIVDTGQGADGTAGLHLVEGGHEADTLIR